MTQIPGVLRRETPSAARPARSLFEILGTLGPAPESTTAAPFRAACALEAARRNRPSGPPRPTPHGAAPPAP
jgi:hypothetical protein